jgi:hypothetical protein
METPDDRRITKDNFFPNMLLLLFYPFGCFRWIYICRKHNIGSKKQYRLISVLGFSCYAFAWWATTFSDPLRAYSLWGCLAAYIILATVFVRLCEKNLDIIEPPQTALRTEN